MQTLGSQNISYLINIYEAELTRTKVPNCYGYLSSSKNKIITPKKDIKTKFIKDIKPRWNDNFLITLNKATSNILIEVYEHNAILKDTKLGETMLNLEIIYGSPSGTYDDWSDLTLVDKKGTTTQQGKIHVKIKIMPNFIPGAWVPIEENVITVGLGWDLGREVFDLDASVTSFNEIGEPKESVYFSQKTGIGGSVLHHGDNLTGAGDGDDELITIKLNEVPETVQSLAVTVNSYKGNSLIKAKSAYIRLFNEKYEIGKFILNKTKDCIGLLLGLLERNPSAGKWFFRVMVDPIEGNCVKSSYDSLKKLITTYNSTFSKETALKIHPLPGEILFTPNTWIPIQNIMMNVGLGWEIAQGNSYDLDASILTFDNSINLLETIYHKNLKSSNGAIVHCGDSKVGGSLSDDEIISINFPSLDSKISIMAVIVNSFKGNDMIGAEKSFIRLFTTQAPIGCHILNSSRACTGLFLGIFKRDMQTLEWKFQVIIQPISGIQATESVNDVINILKTIN